MGVLKTLAGYDAICGIRINSSSLSRVTVGVRQVSFLLRGKMVVQGAR